MDEIQVKRKLPTALARRCIKCKLFFLRFFFVSLFSLEFWNLERRTVHRTKVIKDRVPSFISSYQAQPFCLSFIDLADSVV